MPRGRPLPDRAESPSSDGKRSRQGERAVTGGSYELVRSEDGEYTARVSARGLAVLAAPAINRGTAFTYEQRAQLGLTGLLPTGVSTLDSQLRRTYAQFRQQSGD